MGFALICSLIVLVILVALIPIMRRQHRNDKRAIIEMMNQEYDQMMYSHIEEFSCLRRENAEKIKLAEDQCAAKIDEVEKRATVFQDRLGRILHGESSSGSRWRSTKRDLDKILRTVEEQHYLYFAAMTKPHLELNRDDPFSAKSCLEQYQVEMQRFQLSLMVGLSEHTPPELIAQQIADSVKQAVLQKWQAQSALLLGEKA